MLSLSSEIHNDKPFACIICGKAFMRRGTLRIHQWGHSREKPFKCNTCGLAFPTILNLECHQNVHEEDKLSVGKICGETSTNCIKSINTRKKPFECDICGKAFAISCNLKSHIRVHTGEKPYVCYTCGSSFTQASSLSIHQRVHTGEKPFVCVTCGKGFTQRGSHRRHQELHIRRKQSESYLTETVKDNVPRSPASQQGKVVSIGLQAVGAYEESLVSLSENSNVPNHCQ